ncbi:MAG: leucyl aminopeptidase, partial [bacterium]
SKNEEVPVAKLIIVEHDAAKIADIENGIYLGTTIATAVNTTRDLANEPPNVVTPQFLAEYARQMSAGLGLQCTIWEGEKLVAERMNCLLAVGNASANPPCFIRVDYSPEIASKRVALVGKGLCYDSGGLSLKPAEYMRHMKTDMAGAASVLGALSVIARLKPGVAVSAFLPICENMVSGTSYKVDDVLTARNGVTIEIDNTDAEGRLVLADALSVAAEGGFDEIIDVATLTGGCMVALARRWTGIMGNNQPLIDAVSAAGNAVGERMWNLPLDEEIREMLDSDIADIKNSGTREASASQGGVFLQEFVGDTPWAHLDIAGTSMLEKDRAYEPKGCTGVPVRTLVEYIMGL